MFRFTASLLLTASALVLGAATASASALNAHGHPLALVPSGRANASQSSNWFGYNQGTLEQGGKLFHSIAGNWRVPRASQHVKHQAEYSSDWIGIGGGCVDSGCDASDSTLIQTGTEQDVASNGTASYSAWWETIPAPSLTISMKIKPGDRMHASIAEPVTGSNVWKINLRDLTRHESYSKTVPYSSSQDTAEWIEETPLIIGSGAGFAALPNLTSPVFAAAQTNGKPARLKKSEQVVLTTSSGKVIGRPSAPDPDRDGFNACSWSSICRAPGTS
jgi:hypothetical protein